VDFSTFPEKIQNAFLNTIANFERVKFVWKVDRKTINRLNLGKNVYLSEWVPQQAILGRQGFKFYKRRFIINFC